MLLVFIVVPPPCEEVGVAEEDGPSEDDFCKFCC